MDNMDELKQEVEKSGMYMVDSNNTQNLLKEFVSSIKESDELCEILDPDTTPYKSKYAAREILDKICNKLEATRTIASLEKNRKTINDMNLKIAIVRVRLGIISWEVDEPHNAQTELDLAADYFFPLFVELVKKETSGEDNVEEDKAKWTSSDIDSLMHLTNDLSLLMVENINQLDFANDSLKCLNMLGILWAGRGQIQRSFLYLIGAKNIYSKIQKLFNNIELVEINKKKEIEQQSMEIESSHTHTLFYLAQAYGHLGDAKKSSFYCRETLERQLNQGLNNIKNAFEWSKNCCGMSDFYISISYYRRAALALSSSEYILKTKVLNNLQSNSNYNIETIELQADINKRWVKLDLIIFKRAYEREIMRQNVTELDIEWQEVDDVEPDLSAEQSLLESNNNQTNQQTVFSFSKNDPASLFSGLQVPQPTDYGVADITTFESARLLYIRAVARLEEAKKVYVLDGHVTEHVNLLVDHSKLYHYLALFESDIKRRLAMEGRRPLLLEPLLTSLNKAPFEALHKQISYELGETYMALLDIKMEKLQCRGRGDESPLMLKKAELNKCNEYIRGSIAMFCHFLHFYSPSEERQRLSKINAPYASLTLAELRDQCFLAPPDDSILPQEEIRPLLNAHFLMARMLSKVLSPPEESAASSTQWTVAALKKYDWVRSNAPPLCAKKQVAIADVFQQEYRICEEMVALLPSKIDRMHYSRK